MKLGVTPNSLSTSDILQALNNRLNALDNFQAKVLGPINAPGVADTEFTVNHNLGIKPTNYIVNVDRNAVVYDSRRVDWTDKAMFLKCTAASAVLYLIIL